MGGASTGYSEKKELEVSSHGYSSARRVEIPVYSILGAPGKLPATPSNSTRPRVIIWTCPPRHFRR